MRQFGGVQSTDILPIPHNFERVDGRGRGELDWMVHYAGYIAMWNNRVNYIVPFNPPAGDGKRELKTYLQWYKSWATIYLLKPSTQAPIAYHQSAPEHRLVRDYIMETNRILGPLIGRHGENASSLQLAVDEVGELSANLSQQLHFDLPSYREPSTSYNPFRGQQESQGEYQGRRRSISTAAHPRRADDPHQSIAETSRSGSQRSIPDTHRHSSFVGFEEFAHTSYNPFGGASTQRASTSQNFEAFPWMASMSTPFIPAAQEFAPQPNAPPQLSEQQEEEDIILDRPLQPPTVKLKRARRPPRRYGDT